MRLTPRVPRVVLESNSQYGQHDPQSQEARSSWEPSSDSKRYGDTCSNTVDHRISGVPLSAVEPQNTLRENEVKKLIEKIENHKHKESFLQDLSQTQKITNFSRESKFDRRLEQHRDLPTLRKFLPNSNVLTAMPAGKSIIYCSCGRNMKSSQSPKEFDQNNRDVTSIPGYVIKKNSSRGAKHGPSERQSCVTKLKRCCKKLVKKRTEAIHRHLHDGTTTTSSDFRCHSLGGSSRIWDRVALL